jgi:predicted enzyme related to lactoylglutathione lyase
MLQLIGSTKLDKGDIMPVPVHFEIAADDVKRAIKFYSRVFGWTMEKIEGEDYWLISTSGEEDEFAMSGGMMERIDPSDSTVLTFDVDSLDAFARKITEAGGKVTTPRISLPGLGDIQYCQDSEGNSFGIIEYEEVEENEQEGVKDS